MQYTVWVSSAGGGGRIVLTTTDDVGAACSLIGALVAAARGVSLEAGVTIEVGPPTPPVEPTDAGTHVIAGGRTGRRT